MPHVAWGHVSSQTDIVPMMWLHSLQFDLIERTQHLARRQGSALLQQVFETLRQTAERTSTPQDQVPPESKLVIYVGHDTELGEYRRDARRELAAQELSPQRDATCRRDGL